MTVVPEPACLDEATVVALVTGELDPKRVERAERHLAECAVCRETVAAVGSDPFASQRAEHSRSHTPLPALGQVIAGKYRLERILGRGSMGTVIAGRHVEFGHLVAIKVLHHDAEDAGARFLREAQTCARLGSEHIPRVFDLGHLAGGAPFIVMEHLNGEDLAHVIQRGPVPDALAVDYVRQACIALAQAHAAGVIHRDLKPANLFLSERAGAPAQIKVLDFGLSKLLKAVPSDAQLSLTLNDSLIGTPAYMSPEQMHASRDVEARSDIWSLGVILYELLTARRPFQAANLVGLGVAIATKTPAPPSSLIPGLRPELDAIVLRCLEKQPAKRFASIEELSAALLGCVTQPMAAAPLAPSALEPIAKRQITPPPRALSRKRILAAGLLLAAVALALWIIRRW